jgi:peptidoglycan/xylan/chitin deacetylase (PgdA/CDA1 family)
MASTVRTLAILAYHRVGPPPPGSWETWFSVSEDTFVAHLRYLKEHGWRVIDLDELFAALEAPNALGERSVLITFDDGHRTLCAAAARALAEFRFPAVCFVPSDFVGRSSLFNVKDGEPEEPICDVAELRELRRARVSVQSHGASHEPFTQLDPATQERELARSKAVLEAAVGHPVQAFAFPYGDVGPNGRELDDALRRTGYRAAFAYSGGPISLPITNPYRLPRVPIGPDTDLAQELRAV